MRLGFIISGGLFFLFSLTPLRATNTVAGEPDTYDVATASNAGNSVTFRKAPAGYITPNDLLSAGAALFALPTSSSTVIAIGTDNGVATINYVDTGANSDFGAGRDVGSENFTMVKTSSPSTGVNSGTFNPHAEDDQYAMEATGFIYIPAAGTYTFAVKSDDGSELILGTGSTVVTEYNGGRSASYGNNQGGTAGQPGVIDSVVIFTAAGYYPYELLNVQGNGNASVQLTAVAGSQPEPTGGQAGFLPTGSELVGDTADGGLAVYQNLTLTYAVTGNPETETNTLGTVDSGVSVVKTGSGTLVLDPTLSTNVYTGATVVEGGALQAVDGVGLSADSNLTLAGGVFESSGTFTRTVGTGADQVQWTGAGGFSAYGGALDVTLNGGTGSVTWGAANFLPNGSALLFGSSTANNSVVFENALDLGGQTQSVLVTAGAGGDSAQLSGAISDGGLQIGDAEHTGTLILSGANTYAGGTTLSGGTLIIANTSGSATGSGLVSVNGGTLRGTGTVGGALAVNSGGTLAPGTSAATGSLTVGGNLTLASGSATDLRLNGAGAGTGYDQVRVGGTASLGGSLGLQFGFVPSVGESFQLFTASGFTNAFSAIDPSITNLRYSFTNGDLTVLAYQTTFLPYAQSPNQQAVARVLDAVAYDPRTENLEITLDNLPVTELPGAFEQISPAPLLALPQIMLGNTRAALSDIDQHLADVRAGSTGLSLSQLNFFEGDIPLNNLIAGTEVIPTGIRAFQPTPDNRWDFFLSGAGDFGAMEAGGDDAHSSFSGGRFEAGADYRVTRETAVGIYAGYDGTDATLGTATAKVDSARFGTYASWKDAGGDWLGGTIGGAYHALQTDRTGFEGTASGSTGGTEFNNSLRYGHDFACGPWTITPTAAMEYTSLDFSGYTESGSLAPLGIAAEGAASCRSEIGWTVTREFQAGSVQLRPYVQAGWDHEFLNTAQALNARLASGAGSAFTVGEASIGQESATFGAGLNAVFTQILSGSIGYAGEANGQFQDQTFNATLRVLF